MKIQTAWLGNLKQIYARIFSPLQTWPKLKWGIVGGMLLIIAISITWSVIGNKPPKFIQPTQTKNTKTQLSQPQEIIAVLSRMAYERDLRDLDFATHNSLGGSEVVVHGALDAESQSVLKRMLAQFYKQYQTAIPVSIDITTASQQLPFTISEVITGPMASIVTNEGERVFVGDRIHGYQLIRIEPGKLVFVGDRRIEVAW